MVDILSKYFKNLSRNKMKSFKNNKNSSLSSSDLSEHGLFLYKDNMLSFTPHLDYSIIGNINFDNKFPKIKYSPFHLKPSFNNRNNYINNKLKKNKSNDNFISIKINDEEYSPQKDNNKSHMKNKTIIKNLKILKKNEDKDEEKKMNTIMGKIIGRNDKSRKKTIIKRNFTFTDLACKQFTLDPMNYIQWNFLENPHDSNLFNSYKLQIKALGKVKYRRSLLDGVNIYNKNYLKYKNLKWPTGYDIKNEEKKTTNKIINTMLDDLTPPSFIFNDFYYNYKKNKKMLKEIKSFSTDNTLKKSRNKRIDNLRLKLNEITNNESDNIGRFINKNYNCLSFDKKMNLFLLKAQKTSNYIFKKTNLYHMINKMIFETKL